MTFASKFDEAAFFDGPPALFAPDPRGNLRIDPERTREAWLAVPGPQGREAGVYVVTDRATGCKMVLASNCPALMRVQARETFERAADYASARAETMQQWAIPGAQALASAAHEG